MNVGPNLERRPAATALQSLGPKGPSGGQIGESRKLKPYPSMYIYTLPTLVLALVIPAAAADWKAQEEEEEQQQAAPRSGFPPRACNHGERRHFSVHPRSFARARFRVDLGRREPFLFGPGIEPPL